jgi:hypothetical protein
MVSRRRRGRLELSARIGCLQVPRLQAAQRRQGTKGLERTQDRECPVSVGRGSGHHLRTRRRAGDQITLA